VRWRSWRRFTNQAYAARFRASSLKEGPPMKKLISIALIMFAAFLTTATAQNSNSSTASTNSSAAKPRTPRKPVFRATKDQIKQAQKILKDRNFYGGEESGKLDADTRAGLKKYQTAESLKVTGTLNKITLEKMSIVLTDRQRVM
jgi:hypothetical protein